MSSSISRQLVLWLAVPLMLLALCGALVHYFNSVAPGVISSDRRLKEAANALMARLQIESGPPSARHRSEPQAAAARRPTPSPSPFATAQGRLLLGDARLPAVAMTDAAAEIVRHGADRSAQRAHAGNPIRHPEPASSS